MWEAGCCQPPQRAAGGISLCLWMCVCFCLQMLIWNQWKNKGKQTSIKKKTNMQQRINNTLCGRWQWIITTVCVSVHMDSSNMYDAMALLSQCAATMIKSLSAFPANSSKTQCKNIFSTRQSADWRRPECIEAEAPDWSDQHSFRYVANTNRNEEDRQSVRETDTDRHNERERSFIVGLLVDDISAVAACDCHFQTAWQMTGCWHRDKGKTEKLEQALYGLPGS